MKIIATGTNMIIVRGTAMDKGSLFQILQLAGGTFPTGGFSQSWGLETYVSEGSVKTVAEFEAFLQMYLKWIIGNCEGPGLCRAYDMAENWEEEELNRVEELMTAMKLTKESKECGLRMGKALLRIAVEMTEDEQLATFYKAYKNVGVNYPVAFGIICNKLGISKVDCLQSFVFSSVNGIIQSGIKLVPLGNVEAQKIMINLKADMEACVEIALETDIQDASNFCPGLDIASMRHENLKTRLYMS